MQKTEHEYALAFDRNPHPMWVIDRETMQFLAVNDATVRAYGYSRAELLTMSARDMRPANAVPVLMEAWKRFYADGPHEEPRAAGLWTHRRKDGTEIVVEITATDLVWAGRPAALVHALDVTERVASERAARENRERFEIVSRSINDTIWDWNILTGRVWRSQNTEGIFGAQRAEIDPTIEGWGERLHPDDRERVLTGMREALERGDRTWSSEYRIQRPDGSWSEVLDRALVRYDAAGRPVRMLGSMVDITDRKRADRALLDQQRRFKAVFDNAQDALLITGDDGRFLDANPAACAMFGYPREELLERTAWDLILPEHREEYRERMRQLVREGLQAGEARGQRRDGTVVEVEYRTVANIEHGAHLTVMRDITDRKRSEASLRSLSGRILRVQDEERRRIARELHDSTAQSLAALTLELLVIRADAAALRPEARRSLEEIHTLVDGCARELRTISYLLHPPLLDEMGLATALRGYLDGFSQRSGVAVELDLAADFARLPREVETTLFRIVQECLTNVHRHSGSPVARVRLALDERAVVLEVADEGRGLGRGNGTPDGDRRPNEPLELGVGIAGMKERVRQLGGHLELDSRERGLTVRAYLPREVS